MIARALSEVQSIGKPHAHLQYFEPNMVPATAKRTSSAEVHLFLVQPASVPARIDDRLLNATSAEGDLSEPQASLPTSQILPVTSTAASDFNQLRSHFTQEQQLVSVSARASASQPDSIGTVHLSPWTTAALQNSPLSILLLSHSNLTTDMEILPPKQGDWARSPVCGSPVSVLDPVCPAIHQAPVRLFGKPCISYMVRWKPGMLHLPFQESPDPALVFGILTYRVWPVIQLRSMHRHMYLAVLYGRVTLEDHL